MVERNKILIWNDFSLQEESGKELLKIKYTTLGTYLRNHYQLSIEYNKEVTLLELRENKLYVNSHTFIKDNEVEKYITSLFGLWYLFSKQ